jgi:hypothetical protein
MIKEPTLAQFFADQTSLGVVNTNNPFPQSPASMNPAFSPKSIPLQALSTSNPSTDLESALYNRKAPALRAMAWAQSRCFAERSPSNEPIFQSPITRRTVSPLLEEPPTCQSVEGICAALGPKSTTFFTKFFKTQYLLIILTCILIGVLIHVKNLDGQIDELKQFNQFLISNQDAQQMKNSEVIARMSTETRKKFTMEIEIMKRIHELELEK